MIAALDRYLRVTIALTALLGLTAFFFHIIRFVAQRFFTRRSSGIGRAAMLVISATLSIASIIGISYLYVYHGFGHQPEIYRYGDRQSQMVAITFDDGPSLEFTPRILDILRDHNVFATFFLVGSHVEKYPDIAQRIVEEGHEIGNHTQNHRNIPTLSTLDLNYEVLEATRVITEATGQYPEYIRPPRGMYDARFLRLSTLLGQKVVLWTVSSRDWRFGTTSQAIIRNVMSRVKGGDILLFHDSGALVRNEGGDRSATVKALPEIISRLQQKGLRIVPLKVLLMGEEGEEERPLVDMEE